MRALIFEDEKWINLTPLSYLHPVYELRCGKTTLLEKILPKLGAMEKGLYVRKDLESITRKKSNYPVNEEDFFKEDLLLINGRWLVKEKDTIKVEEESIFTCDDNVVYAVVNKERVRKLWNGDFVSFLSRLKEELPNKEIKVDMINYIWEFIHYNPEMLKEDFISSGKKGIECKFPSQSLVVGTKDEVYIHPEAEIHPYVVLDVSSGPIYIDKNAKVFPFARIEGPCYIGEDTHIMPGANIREGNSFGPVCRIGGEVEESIFQGYANKFHDGFIGHSFIGEWVNLGGLTTNSDLKNDYSNVTVYLNGKPTNTGQLKVGSFIGDHTKTGIGSMLNTGTIAGVMCNIASGGILPKFFPSFSWFINGKYMKGTGLEAMLKTARIAMSRREKQLTLEEEELIRRVYEVTKEIRREYIKRSRRT
ncbi:hypothetical protein J7K43_07465 [Candidatus Calescamantes bacterium]|nr:hypothetical protein [Candidatus Calescamantes bacterium]